MELSDDFVSIISIFSGNFPVMSAAVVKRKMEDPLMRVLSSDYSEPKRARPARSGLCAEVRERVLCVLKTLMQHIFALPFVKIETDQDNNNNTTNNNNNKTTTTPTTATTAAAATTTT